MSLGLGIAVISTLSLNSDDKVNLEIVELPRALEPESTYGIVTRHDKRKDALQSRFIELLLS